jgi:uncharacterized protein YjbJ (UPF0337 family)
MDTDKSTDKDLGTQGAENTVKGKAKQAAGTVQKKVGQVTGDKSMEAKGKTREVGGKVQSKAGKVEQKVDTELKEDV